MQSGPRKNSQPEADGGAKVGTKDGTKDGTEQPRQRPFLRLIKSYEVDSPSKTARDEAPATSSRKSLAGREFLSKLSALSQQIEDDVNFLMKL